MNTFAHVPANASVSNPNPSESRRMRWSGRVLTGWASLFLTVDAVGKLLQLDPVVRATTELGYPAEAVFTLGMLESLCLVLCLVRPTAVLGTVLLTGYLGGAVATHFRLGNPLFSHTLFPVYAAAMMWGGLCLREPHLLAALFPRRAR
jgi:hypothetical protein